MGDVLSVKNVMRIGKLSLLGVCLIAGVGGCSSKLQTTITSGTHSPSKPPVEASEPAEMATEVGVQEEALRGVSPMDIPVEEPARPTLRQPTPTEIFTPPRTGADDPSVSPSLDAPEDEKSVVASSSPTLASPPGQPSPQELPAGLGIPPIGIEPEMPARPTHRQAIAPVEESASVSSMNEQPAEIIQESPSVSVPDQEPPEEPMQMAKVAPASPEIPEIAEENTKELLKTLGDVYFDYDRFSIRNDAITVLKENAQTLAAGLSNKEIVIEGHCDQRGTESYNMVLGKRRANAVKDFLVHLGVPDENIQVVSYGKEKPFCTDQNEQCWKENRRGHFVVK